MLRSDDSGKLLLLTDAELTAPRGIPGPSGSPAPSIQIFFDDNIERDRTHIVDVRNIGSNTPANHSGFAQSGRIPEKFDSVPFGTTNGKFLRKSHPLEAILNKNYFVEQVEEVLAQHYGI
jgi:hypothetical protein